MKFSYHWIRELVPGLDAEPAELMRLITHEDGRVRRRWSKWARRWPRRPWRA